MKAICVISARAGSKGVKSKNILNFISKPLIAWSIIQAIKSKKFLGVFVSTDSKKIAQISKRYGAQVTFIRSKKLSGNYVPKFFVAIWNALPIIKKNDRNALSPITSSKLLIDRKSAC